jgi:hypothetical protein
MKNLIRLFIVFFLNGIAGGIQAKEKVKYRYAYSCDGFNQDRDDVAASAMTLALFDRAGLSDRIVHYHFNTNFGGEPSHAGEHRKSVLRTAVLFGIIDEENGDDAFFDVSRSEKERTDAINHLAKEFSASTKMNPLIMICAGGVQVPYLALQKAIREGASTEVLQSITFLSHGKANEQTCRKNSDNTDYRNNWDSLKQLTPASKFIGFTSPLVNGRCQGGVNASQNSTAWNQGPRGNKGNGVADWQWLVHYGKNVEGFGFSGTKGEWLLGRLKAAGAPEIGHNGNAEGDASDAGMVFGYILGQPTDATMEEIRDFFMK